MYAYICKCVCVNCRCTLQSECVDASVDNRWKSRLTGSYSSCVSISNIQPASLSTTTETGRLGVDAAAGRCASFAVLIACV